MFGDGDRAYHRTRGVGRMWTMIRWTMEKA